MAREYRVLSRLWEAYEPAPRAILLCEDKEIVGAPFFVMQRRSGFVVPNRRPLPDGITQTPADLPRECRRALSTRSPTFIRSITRSSASRALGRPDGFVRRQITGWMDRWEKAKTSEVPLMNQARRVVSREYAADAAGDPAA